MLCDLRQIMSCLLDLVFSFVKQWAEQNDLQDLAFRDSMLLYVAFF